MTRCTDENPNGGGRRARACARVASACGCDTSFWWEFLLVGTQPDVSDSRKPSQRVALRHHVGRSGEFVELERLGERTKSLFHHMDVFKNFCC